jgi:membrane-associated protease RseP (regulator of RpoE activity)
MEMRNVATGHSGMDRGTPWLLGLALVAGLGLANPELSCAQASDSTGRQRTDPWCSRTHAGIIGINRVTCRGDCSLTISRIQPSAWSFSVEPQIAEIAPSSPASRALEVGDRIVAIDGFLITTPEGGRRFANIEPGRDVTVRFRRGRQVGEAVLRAGPRCMEGWDPR